MPRSTGPANHNGTSGHTSQTSFCSLQCDSTPARTNTMEITMAVTTEPPGTQRRPRAPQALLQSLDTAARAGPAATQALLQSLDTAERAGPAATTRAADPSAVSGHCGESRPSGDHTRRRPFCSLWTLRPSAPQALLQSLDTAERAGPAATTRAAGPSAVSGHCGDSRPSGDHARRRPFCSLWTLRPSAPQALLQSLDTAERAGPAATTRAAGPSAVSGHCGESRPSGDHARRRPFCSLWTLQALLQSRQ